MHRSRVLRTGLLRVGRTTVIAATLAPERTAVLRRRIRIVVAITICECWSGGSGWIAIRIGVGVLD